jgi:hypothetical protein
VAVATILLLPTSSFLCIRRAFYPACCAQVWVMRKGGVCVVVIQFVRAGAAFTTLARKSFWIPCDSHVDLHVNLIRLRIPTWVLRHRSSIHSRRSAAAECRAWGCGGWIGATARAGSERAHAQRARAATMHCACDQPRAPPARGARAPPATAAAAGSCDHRCVRALAWLKYVHADSAGTV